MYDTLIQTVFGWPAMLLSLGFAIAGIIFRRAALSMVGGVLFLLPGWYLSLYSLVFAILPLCIFGSAFAVSKNKPRLASLLIVPPGIALIGLAIVVLSQ
jgi:hypothetical protein